MTWRYARHAQPAKEYDQIDLVLENTSLGLSPDGREQARQLASSQTQFQTILHSSFARAKETATIVHEVQGATAQRIEVPELAEVRFGLPNRANLHEWIATGRSAEGETVRYGSA